MKVINSIIQSVFLLAIDAIIDSIVTMLCMIQLSDLCYSLTHYQENQTPLYVASGKGHHDVVQTLLEGGADVNIATYVSDSSLYKT